MHVSNIRRHGTPGNAIKVIGVGHATWGVLAYRRPLAELLATPLDSVGDGIFAKAHSDDARAAAFWFLLAAPLIVLTGRLVEAAERSRDAPAMRAAGRTVFGIGVLGTAVMPRSGFLAVFPVGWWLTRRAGSV
jgi:hypothetical protein